MLISCTYYALTLNDSQVEDEVTTRRGMGKFADKLAFEPYTPEQVRIHEAVKLFNPVEVVFHQVGKT